MYPVTVRPSTTVLEVKRLAEPFVSAPPYRQRLVFRGRVLHDDQRQCVPRNRSRRHSRVVRPEGWVPPPAEAAEAPRAIGSAPEPIRRRVETVTQHRRRVGGGSAAAGTVPVNNAPGGSNSVLLGTFTLPADGELPQAIQQMLQEIGLDTPPNAPTTNDLAQQDGGATAAPMAII